MLHCPLQAAVVRAVALPKVPRGQAFCVALVEPAAHQCPALHTFVHREDVWPVVEPYLPAGHAFCVALVEPAPHQ